MEGDGDGRGRGWGGDGEGAWGGGMGDGEGVVINARLYSEASLSGESYFSYVLSCLWDDAYKRTLAANRKE